MNSTYRILTIFGLITVLTGFSEAVHAQQPIRVVQEASSEELTAVELYNRGVDKLEQGDYAGAISDFGDALQLSPKMRIPTIIAATLIIVWVITMLRFMTIPKRLN